MVAYTTTYNLKKPTVADDEDVWGGYLNDSMDLIDDVLNGTTPVTGIDINSGTIDNVVVGGTTAVAGTFTVLTANTSLGVTGNITVSGTVDGRDVAADGTKLDGVESGATADQTKADIDALGIAASTAATLATARNIALSGDVSGSASFNGSANISITATVADDSHNHVISNVDGLQTALDGKLSTSGTAANSNLLDGYNSSTTEGGNTVAVRNNDGYLHANYFNGTGTFSTVANTSGMGRFTGTNGSDTYGRSYTAAAARALLNVADGANNITNNNQLTNGAGYTTYTSNQATNTTSNVTHNQVVGTAYVYSPGYLQAPNAYIDSAIYHNGDTDTRLLFGTNTITLQTGGSSEITVNTTGVRLGDTGNGYFQPVSGSYGSIQIDGGAHNGWEGYSIGGRVVFMHDNSNVAGIFNDVNGEWMIQASLNGNVRLYYNGSSKLQTLSNGANVSGNLYTDGSVAEDYDALSGTSPTCNVDNAGAFSLTMSGNTTFTFSGADSGYSMGFILQLTGNGSTVTWPSSVDWAGGAAPDAPASGASNLYVFWTRDGGSNWHGVLSSAAYA